MTQSLKLALWVLMYHMQGHSAYSRRTWRCSPRKDENMTGRLGVRARFWQLPEEFWWISLTDGIRLKKVENNYNNMSFRFFNWTIFPTFCTFFSKRKKIIIKEYLGYVFLYFVFQNLYYIKSDNPPPNLRLAHYQYQCFYLHSLLPSSPPVLPS